MPAPGGAPGPPAPAAAGNVFDEQRRNRRDTWLLIAGFVALLAFLGFGFDLFVLHAVPRVPASGMAIPVPVTAVVAALVGVGSAGFSYFLGDRMVLASSGARPVTFDDPIPGVRPLMNVVTEMAIAAGLPMPRVYVVDDPDPNAFATGRNPDRASIAVTTGLLTTMTRDELQGVIAHEMSHVQNLDIRKMTVVAALLGAVLLISDWATRLRLQMPLRHGPSRDGDRRGGDGGGGPLAVVLLVVWLLAVLLAPLVGRLLATTVSRRREYLADATGAALTRNPLGLASALRKLEAAAAPTARIHQGTAHLCIADPLGRRLNERSGRFADLFATHPPIAERVARLEAMAYRGRG